MKIVNPKEKKRRMNVSSNQSIDHSLNRSISIIERGKKKIQTLVSEIVKNRRRREYENP